MSEGARRRLAFRVFSDAVFGGKLGWLVHGAFDLLARLSPRPPESDPHFTAVLARAAEEARLENELRFTLLVESVTEYAVFMLDESGHVATWNAGAERIEGYEAREILGQHFSIFCGDADDRDGKCERALTVAARDGRCEDEGFLVRKDGTRFWAHVSFTAIRTAGGELVGFAMVTRDMTSTKKSEEQLLRLAHAEESVRVRDEFLTIASHELRTPVTALQLQLQSLQLRTSTMDKPLAQKVERVARSVTRLSDLIELLLDASQLALGQVALQREPLEADSVLSELVDELQSAASKAGCSLLLAADRHVVVRWDRVRIDQVMTNLIGNAIKYGPGKPIQITLRRAGEHAVRIEVDDEGPGIPENDLSRIFGRFERASSLRHHGGLGLGLYVAQEIVQAHGGSIAVRNKPAGGACFSVLLPRGRAEDEQVAALTALG